MATFYGGEELVEIKRFQQNFTPADQQEFTIYTVPAGRYAIVKKWMLDTAFDFGGNDNYNLLIEHNFFINETRPPTTFNGGAKPSRYVEALVEEDEQNNPLGILSSQRSYDTFVEVDYANKSRDLYLDEGERIFFKSRTNLNVQTSYYILIHEFKAP